MCVRKCDILFQTLSTVSHATSPSPQFFSKELAQITLVLFLFYSCFSPLNRMTTRQKSNQQIKPVFIVGLPEWIPYISLRRIIYPKIQTNKFPNPQIQIHKYIYNFYCGPSREDAIYFSASNNLSGQDRKIYITQKIHSDAANPANTTRFLFLTRLSKS